MPKRGASDQERAAGRRGEGIDSHGGPVFDPTANVRDLNEASSKRQDDLSVMRERLFDAELRLAHERTIHNQKLIDVYHKEAERDAEAERRRIDERSLLISEFHEKLVLAESKRIDANRAGDQLQVAIAAEKAGAQATVLVQQTADTLAKSLAALTQQFNDRIGLLEKSSNIGAGRSSLSEPAQIEVINELRALSGAILRGEGKSAGLNAFWLYGVAAIAVISAIVSIVHMFGAK